MSRQSSAARRRTDGFFTKMRQPVLFGLAAVLFLGVYYFFFVQRKHNYLTGRNFRYLATVGSQLQSSLDNQATLLRSLSLSKEEDLAVLKDPQVAAKEGQENRDKENPAAPPSDEQTEKDKKDRDPREKKAMLLKDFAPGFENVKLIEGLWEGATQPPQAIAKLKRSPEETWIDFFQPLPDAQSYLHGNLRLGHQVEPLFRSRGAFDVLLLADVNGEVLHHQGPRDLSVKQLASLLDKSPSFASHFFKERPKIDKLLSSSSDSYLVELNGREYHLFVEPVTLPLESSLVGDKSMHWPERTWLICGLVPRKEFVYKSLAVSSALLFFLMGLLFLATLSWPFLKLKLIGKMQRIGVFDVLLLGVCSVLGVSIATLFALDLWAFGKLKETSTLQLEDLAARIVRNTKAEIKGAYEVLTRLEERTLKLNGGAFSAQRKSYGDALKAYPLAHTFTLMQPDGYQIYKGVVDGAPSSNPPPQISVAKRAYFQRARDKDVWDLRGLESGSGTPKAFIEPIVGWTNGVRYAMISKPVTDPGKKVVVSALGMPMVSLINPVLPPGFKFAVVNNEDPNGKVLFHSDPERNSIEDFLVETDHDRRLRSAIFARRAETMKKVHYWGEDYIARTEPVGGLPWTVVALRDLQILRSVNGGWLSTTLLFLLVYVSLLAAFVVAVALARPSYRADWIWPDPRRQGDYQALVSSYLLAGTGFLLAIWRLPGSGELVGVSLLVPALALVMAYARLRRRTYGREALALGSGLLLLLVLAIFLFWGEREHNGRWLSAVPTLLFLAGGFSLATGTLPFPSWRKPSEELPPRRSIHQTYSLCGALLLLLTAVLPTAGFFKTAHRVHSESYLRHGQLKLAQELRKRAGRIHQRIEKVNESDRKGLFTEWLAVEPCESETATRGRDVYSCSFYSSRPDFLTANASAVAAHRRSCKCDENDDSDPLPAFLEGFLPRSSERVMEMRELLHDNSSDCTWFWKVDPQEQVVLHSNDYPDRAIHLTSRRNPLLKTSPPAQAGVLPGLAPLLARSKSADLWDVLLLVSLPTLFGFALLLSRFVARKIFLVDLLEPLWTERDETGPATTGRNIFLVTQGKPWKEREGVRSSFFCLDLARFCESRGAWAAIRPTLREKPLLILVEGFEHRLGDDACDTRKVEILEDLVAMPDRTIVVVSPVSPARLCARRNGRGRNGQMSPPIQQRLRALLSFFMIRDESLQVPAESSERHAEALFSEILLLIRRQRQERKAGAASKIPDVLREECSPHPYLMAIAEELSGQVGGLSREQILEELGERAEGYYHTLWESCTTEEQVVLEHLAEEGLVNEKSRKLLRRLMARGIVRRKPRFQLMNETFRRFVLSSECRGEVLRIEKKAAPSAWDRLRAPFFVSLAASIGFFFATQEALLEGIVASITGLTAGLPGIVKVFDVFGGGDRSKLRLGGSK
jgi:hypothetical protein